MARALVLRLVHLPLRATAPFALSVVALLVSPDFAVAQDAAGTPGGQPPARTTAAVDVVTLKDGRRLEGSIVDENDRFVSLTSGGVTRAYAKDSIDSIERAAPRVASAGDAAASSPVPSPDAAGKDKKKAKGDRRDAPLTEAAKAWLGELLAKSADPDEGVRRSIRAAIGALGPQAIPAVIAAQTAATDPGQKQFLGRLAADLESRRDRRMRGDDAAQGDGMTPANTPAGALARGGPGRRALDDMMQRLSTELELREEQRGKTESILAEVLKKRFVIHLEAQRDGLTQVQVAEKIAPLHRDTLAQMKAVLDEPQWVMFEELALRFFSEPVRGPQPPAPPKREDPAAPGSEPSSQDAKAPAK